MKEAITAKFKQNPGLKTFLLNTGDRELVETSPADSFWGVGLDMKSPALLDKSQWKGRNILGKLSCELRTELAADNIRE